MIGRCLQIIIAVFLPSGLLLATEPLDRATGSGPSADSRDIVYFHPDHPIFIRIHLEIDGRSFEDPWMMYVQSLFTELDVDGDGRLTVEEISGKSNSTDHAPSADAQRLARDPDFWSADRIPFDHAITMKELSAFLIARSRGPFQDPDTVLPPVSGSAVGVTLFELLDINADRSLSEDELAAAGTSLHRRDLDDDGTFSVSELNATSGPFMAQPAVAVDGGSRTFMALSRGTASLEVIREFERRYTSVKTDNGGTLSRDLNRNDIGLEPTAFSVFDTDSDGKLDRDELREFVRNPLPSLEIVVRLGQRKQDQFFVELIGQSKVQNVSLRRSSDGLASIVINDVQIEIAENASGPDVAKQYLLRQFAATDTDQNNYLEEAEAGQSEAFRASFHQFDEDGDGKLFREELTAVVDGFTTAARSRTRMDVNNRGRDLFEIFDLDRNRRLGRRELAQAVQRIELWDTNGDGAVSEVEIPQLYQISFGPGQPQFPGVRIPGQAAPSIAGNNAVDSTAPKWFSKLDRNGDGELIRREFPGTLAAFQEIDQNSDGIVDAVEAEFVK